MADGPKCGKCGGPRVPMSRKGKGGEIWFLGCEKCTGKPPAKKEEKPEDKPAPKKAKWMDGDDWL